MEAALDKASARRPATVRVLVVDDQEVVARTVARWLEREGMRCELAFSGEEALRRCDRTAFDLVLADVHMPGGSGLELARALKARDSTVQVIIMTGSTTVETAVEALRVDADDYLVKPFDPPSLIHAVRRAAEHRRLVVENRDYRRHLEERVREQARGLEALYLSSIESLVRALEAKDPHTRGHSDRVARHALSVQRHMPGVPRESLRIGAHLHDIGKIGLRSDVLLKQGSLSDHEFGQVRRHPVVGVEILSPMLDDRVVLDVVRHHHERWDGRGYPDGLAGEAIPLAARIVSVVDSFDAMISSRPYRSGRTPSEALTELQAEAGRQFDPDVVRVACRILARPAGIA